MVSLFEVPVSVGHSLNSAAVVRQELGAEAFEKHNVFDGEVSDKNGRYFCAGEMSGGRRAGNKVMRCGLIVIDADSLTARDAKKMDFCLSETPYEYLKYTTTRHTPDNPRYRLVFHPSRTMTVEEYRHVTRKICREMAIDHPCKATMTPSSPMLYPLCMAGFEAEASIVYKKGDQVDIDLYVQDIVEAGEYEGEPDTTTNLPMAIPGALSEAVWYQCVLTAYPAKNCDYHDWVMMGMALYHQTYGQKFELWYAWSALNEEKHGRDYDYEGMKTKWHSFKDDPATRGVTFRKLLNETTLENKRVLSVAYSLFLDAITNPADLKRLRTDIQDEKFLFGDVDYKPIARSYVKAVRRCSGEHIHTGEALVALKPEHAVGGAKQYFYNNYLFNRREGIYYSIKDREQIPIVSMNFVYGARMPVSNNGSRKVVHKVLSTESNGYVRPRDMHGTTYVVNGDSVIVEEGRLLLNLFKPESWPESESAFNTNHEIDAKVRQMVLQHFRLLCDNDAPLIKMLARHLAHLRQRPNLRLHWGYAISSLFQGVGKSTLQRIYKIVLGEEQVNTLSAQNIAESFNAYAGAPKLMSFIEEFEFDTRREQNVAIKKMKDMMTSDTISIRKMRTDAHAARAYSAYALFSNDEYVLGHESTGRRWVPIIVQALNAEQCTEILGQDIEQFYNEYHQLMDDYPERFIAFFESINVEGFNTERPPADIAKSTFHDNVPAARVARVLNELIEDHQSLALTADWACESIIKQLVRNHIDFTDTVDAEELRHFKATQLRHLVVTALRTMGYSRATNSKQRIRFAFGEKERTTMNDMWVKSKNRYSGASGLERLQARIKHESRVRRDEALAKAKGEEPNSLDENDLDF